LPLISLRKLKVLYIISDIDKALAFEWVALGLSRKFDLSFVVMGKSGSEFSIFLKTHDIRFHEISNEKYPSKLSKWLCVFKILKKEKPSIVHTHLWQANILGLSSAWVLRIKKRIYTRHHALIHYNEFPTGLKWDKLCNRMATHIIAISNNVKNILIDKDKVNSKKVFLIPHGFDLSYFQNVESDEITRLQEKYKISPDFYPVVGVISRYEKWKGIQFIIPAFKELRKKYPKAHLILVNAHGNYSENIRGMLQSLSSSSYTEILFESNLAELYKLYDVFVHIPVDGESEAFGQTYVEALASGVPSVFTLSGIAPEFIIHEKNALVVQFENSMDVFKSIERILENSELRTHLIAEGIESANLFSLSNMISQLEQLYES